jgi:hypothetical protein
MSLKVLREQAACFIYDIDTELPGDRLWFLAGDRHPGHIDFLGRAYFKLRPVCADLRVALLRGDLDAARAAALEIGGGTYDQAHYQAITAWYAKPPAPYSGSIRKSTVEIIIHSKDASPFEEVSHKDPPLAPQDVDFLVAYYQTEPWRGRKPKKEIGPVRPISELIPIRKKQETFIRRV